MAGYEPKPTDITLYKEKEKTNDRAPDWKGFALVQIPEGAKPGDVVKMEVAVWAKGNYGTMLGGSIKPPMQRQGGGGGESFPSRRDEGFSGRAGRLAEDNFGDGSDIPFIRY